MYRAVALVREAAGEEAPHDRGRWRYEDIDFVAEVISQGTAHNDYGPEKAAYALAGVPVYLIADLPANCAWTTGPTST
ncbi:Uma2 family endonuclease [Streptomyces misionensis]|uniref:Uma2 family endonuclease n=1 Tax=Streptomyces misionensis TaxID=67331 RepID=UPI00367F70DE